MKLTLCTLLLFCFSYSYSQKAEAYVNKKGKIGFKVGDNIVTEAKYESAGPYINGMSKVSIKIKRKGVSNELEFFGFVNEAGEEIVSPKFKYAQDFSDGLAFVKDDNDNVGFCFIDKTGKLAFSIMGLNIGVPSSFSNGFAVFCKMGLNDENNRCGYINKKGEIVIPAVLKKAAGFNNGLAEVTDAIGKSWEIDTTFCHKGTRDYVLTPDWIKSSNGKYSLTNGRNILAGPIYDFARKCDDQYSVVGINNKYGVMDNDGKLIIPIHYDDILNYKNRLVVEDMITYKLDGKFGFLTLSGSEVGKLYYGVTIFNKGLAKVFTNEKKNWVYIDKTGRETTLTEGNTIGYIYTVAGSMEIFNSSIAATMNHVGIKKDGKIVLLPYFTAISQFMDTVYCKIGESVFKINAKLLSATNPTDVESFHIENIDCPECKGLGYTVSTSVKSGGTEANTTYKESTESQRVFNPATRQYDSKTVIKYKPSTTYSKKADLVNTYRFTCSFCNGKGTMKGANKQHIVWNSNNYSYSLK